MEAAEKPAASEADTPLYSTMMDYATLDCAGTDVVVFEPVK